MRRITPLADRLFPRVELAGSCWVWTGASNRGGYGVISRGRRDGTTVVHRAVWELLVGPIPDGLELDHLCRVRSCCNPDHLEPVSRAVNVARGAQAAGVPRRSACRNGHPFTPDNTLPNGSHGRACRACHNAANRRYRARKKTAA
ncbi:HNH endonuclease signature motif containing protein [Streptomyces sp. CC228A]|uniref:HNH endonuclease signature motif containing protein n=1 Tax=Streptomyces sp. CC228A TaxID=2898186 RepID=UPI001F30B019|nr:HNH endonuclease signature motif containing protein [Streptomyces sp. CC228A]